MADHELKQIILKMLNAELEAMHYYQQASRFIKDQSACYHFNLLAQEELEHARTFYNIYPDNDLPEFEALAKQIPEQHTTINTLDPKFLYRLNERTALYTALKLEEEMANSLKMMLAELTSPAARAVIENNFESTLGHYELIKEDYQRLFASPSSAS